MNAVILFQEKYNLKPDGVIGKKTMMTMAEVFHLSIPKLAHFLGQSHVESQAFTKLVENLNYSAQGLAEVSPKRYALNPKARIKVPNALAKKLAGKPMQVGNNYYANRMGNGSEASGDGFKHRGFGISMITGKETQYAFADFVQNPQIKVLPELIVTKYAFESALWYYQTRSVWKYAERVNEESILNVSRLINVGKVDTEIIPIGYDKRLHWTNYYFNLMISL